MNELIDILVGLIERVVSDTTHRQDLTEQLNALKTGKSNATK